jgi:CubicO group peptidase (beta-lactamase class C family)
MIASLLMLSIAATTDTSTAELDAFIEQQQAAYHLTGLSAVIVKGDQLVFSKGYGLASAQVPVASDTVFRLASISKVVTAVALMKLSDDGRAFGLDDDVSGALGFELRNPAFPAQPITYRMLLSHTASLRDNYDLPDALFPENDDSPISLRDFAEGYFKPGGLYYNAALSFTDSAPGTAYEYSNLGLTLVGHLVERLSGKSLEDYSREAIFEPLGMTETSWRGAGFAPQSGLAVPHRWSADGGLVPLGAYGYPDWPAGSLRTSAPHLARLMRMLMNRGEVDGVRVLTQASVDEMTRLQAPTADHQQGLVLYFLDAPTVAGARMGHNGADPGVRTEMYWQTGVTAPVGVILLCNCDAARDPARSAAFKAIRDRLFEHGEAL